MGRLGLFAILWAASVDTLLAIRVAGKGGEVRAAGSGHQDVQVNATANATAESVPSVHVFRLNASQLQEDHEVNYAVKYKALAVGAPHWLRAVAVVVVPFMFWAATSDNAGTWAIFGCYILASVSMNILNKEAVRDLGHPFFLVIIQMVVSDAVMLLVEYKKLKIGRWQDICRWGVVPIAFAGMLTTSMWAFEEATLSAIVILKNVLPIISFGAEKVLFDIPSKTTASMFVSLVVVLGGTLMFGLADFNCTAFGKILILINCCFTLVDRLAQTYFLKLDPDFSISVPACMVINNTMGMVPVVLLAVARGEADTWMFTFRHTSKTTWLWVLASSCCGACLGYVGLKIQKVVSGTSVLVLQNFNKMLIIFVSCFAYKDVLTFIPVVGCVVSILGSLLYGYSRLPSETNGMISFQTKKAG